MGGLVGDGFSADVGAQMGLSTASGGGAIGATDATVGMEIGTH